MQQNATALPLSHLKKVSKYGVFGNHSNNDIDQHGL